MKKFGLGLLLLLPLLSCKAVSSTRPVKVSGYYPVAAERWDINPWYQKTAFLFDDTVVRTIKITLSGEAEKTVLWPRYTVGGSQAYALAEKFELDGETIENVGIRARVNAPNQKLGLKVSFNATQLYRSRNDVVVLTNQANRRFHGLRKVNLRASQNDPSMIREKVASYVFEKAHAPASRVGFARVYVNDRYWGLYLIVEEIDGTFVRARYATRKGELYKGIYKAALVPGYENSFVLRTKLKKGKKPGVPSFLENLQDSDSSGELQDLLDIDNILNYYAACVLVGHWDSFTFNPNNDFLYRHPDGKFRIIAWDLDNTFGSGRGWGFPVLESSVYCMANNENYSALFRKLLKDPYWKAVYAAKVGYLMKEVYNPENMDAVIEKYRKLIRDAVYEDTRKQRDWDGINTADDGNEAWEESFDQKPAQWSAHGFGDSELGLKTWIAERYNELREEIRVED